MRRALVLVAVLALVAGACGDDDAGVEVTDVWARASASMQNAGAVYFTVNGGAEGAVLTGVKVSSDVAATAMLHETAMGSDGAMSMSMVPEVAVPAGASVSFEPGGYHVMMMDLVNPLEVGSTFDITLVFGDGSEVTVTAQVRDE